MPLITVDDVWKRFRIPHEKKTTILDYVGGALSVLEGKRYTYEEFWALKQVSFRINHAESLGIIGPNGSGKSTLLKLMARTMVPDKGMIGIHGTVAPV